MIRFETLKESRTYTLAFATKFPALLQHLSPHTASRQ
jgi:hypothetical protein